MAEEGGMGPTLELDEREVEVVLNALRYMIAIGAVRS